MRFSQVLTSAIAAGVAAAEPLANVLAANNNTLSTLNCKTQAHEATMIIGQDD